MHFDDSATSFTQQSRSPTSNTSTSILSISDDYKSSLTSGYPFITSNPTVTINRFSILFNFFASCPGLLNANGTISYVKLHVVLAGTCCPSPSACSAGFGSTLTLGYLNILAEALSPIIVSSRTPRSFEDTVKIVSEAAIRFPMLLVISDSDIVFPEPGICVPGLSTLLTLGTGSATTQKFWIASCLVGGAGLLADRLHSSNEALRFLDQDTFFRLIPEHARLLTNVNLATLMLIWKYFLTFQHLPSPQIPTSIQQFMSITSDDIALRLGDQDVFKCYIHEFIQVMVPTPVHLRNLTANVQPLDVPTVVAELITFVFEISQQDKPLSVPVLRAVNDRLSSFAHLIPQCDLQDGDMVLSLQDALVRVRALKDCHNTRADFGTARSSSSSDSSGLATGSAFTRLFADNIAAVQHILEDVLANANDYDQQQNVVKAALRASNSLIVFSLTKPPSAHAAASVPALAKLHAINHAVSRVVSAELLKETGQEDDLAITALASALPTPTLLGLLDGSKLNVGNLLTCYNAYKQVRIPGCRVFNMTEILSNITLLRSFILVSITLLKALGLHAENLLTLVDLATAIEEALPPALLFKVLESVIPPSLLASLDHYSSSIKAWLVSSSSAPVGHLVLEASRVHAALKAIQDERRRDLSQFGLPTISLFSSIKPASSSSTSSQPLLPSLKRTPQDSRRADSYPDQSGKRRAKSPSHIGIPLIRARKTMPLEPDDQLAVHFPTDVAIRSPSSPLLPNGPQVANCASGRIAKWGREYVSVTSLLKAFQVQYPLVPLLLEPEILPVLLTVRSGDDNFDRYAPPHASESLKRALRTWYDDKEFKNHRVEKPPDFR